MAMEELEMYNEDQKRKFILSYTKSINTATIAETVFNVTEEFERKWNADICTKSEEEVMPAVTKASGLRLKSNDIRFAILRQYSKWCIQQGIAGACDGLQKIREIGLDKIREQTIANPKHLQDYLDVICEPEEKQSTDNIVRCYCWLAYSGVEEDDILDIKCSDVDLQNRVIRYEKGFNEIKIYDEAFKAFKNCAELDEFLFIHPKFETYRKRVPGDTLVRGIRDLPTVKSMRVELSRKAKRYENELQLKLSYKRIRISGIFYRMLIEETNGHEPNFMPLIVYERDGKEYNLSHSRNTQEAKLRELERNYLTDYERWKKAWLLH